MTLFGIGARVTAPFKPRFSPVTGRQSASTQVDGARARSAR